MELALVEQAADEAQPVFRRRGDAQLVAHLGEMVAADDVLGGVDRVAVIVLEIEIAGEAADPGVEIVIGLGIIGIVRRAVDLPVEIGAGISEVEIADPALDGERGLNEAVVVALRKIK